MDLRVVEWESGMMESTQRPHCILPERLDCRRCAHQVRGTLAERFHLITFDLRGHGRSDAPAEAARYADDLVWADDLAAVLEVVSARRPVLVRWSYGAFVVADYLRAYGEEAISAIALVGASVRLTPPYEGIGPGLLDNVVDMCGADLLATLRLAPEARWVSEYYPIEDTKELRGGGLTVRLRVGDPAWLTRLMLRLGASAELVDPPELGDRVREVASQALLNYG